MAIFLRGNMWWYEYRTRSVRVVKPTGFAKADRAKAQAAYDAFRLGMRVKPRRDAMEDMLRAIYETDRVREEAVAVSSVWSIYEDWFRGKGRKVADKTWSDRRGTVMRFAAWCEKRGITALSDVGVQVARAYVREISAGRKNKTVRNIVGDLICVWEAAMQLDACRHDPWKAARPDDDGSSVDGLPFTPEEERAVLAAAEKVGNEWWLACVIARWTGQRYGDVATLDWSQVDLAARTIAFRPLKTARRGFRVTVPISDALMSALCAIPADGREGFVLPSHALAYVSRTAMDHPFSEVLRLAGLDPGRFTFHSWRHTLRTRLGEAGVPDSVAMRFGWTNLRMAGHYDHASHLSEMRDAVERVSGAFAEG